jgi:hypothetical protein
MLQIEQEKKNIEKLRVTKELELKQKLEMLALQSIQLENQKKQ